MVRDNGMHACFHYSTIPCHTQDSAKQTFPIAKRAQIMYVVTWRGNPLNNDLIYLDNQPMPYMTECSIKRFNINEYHCARYLKHFVLIFMMHNQLTFEENGVPVTLQAGEWYIQRKDMRQSASAPSPSAEYIYIHFTGELSAGSYQCLVLPLRGKYDPQAFDVPLKELHRFANQVPVNQFEVQQRFIGLLGMLHETLVATETLVVQILRYININYARHITSRSLAEVFSYSTEYIERRVKAVTGMTPHAYLTYRRLYHARRQLERSNLPIGQISECCGFADMSLFFKAFKKEYGINPSTWRKNMQAFGTTSAES
jgi:AraC-like DNA-binding protein